MDRIVSLEGIGLSEDAIDSEKKGTTETLPATPVSKRNGDAQLEMASIQVGQTIGMPASGLSSLGVHPISTGELFQNTENRSGIPQRFGSLAFQRSGAIGNVIFSPNGKNLLVASPSIGRERMVMLFSLTEGKELLTIKSSSQAPRYFALSPDGNLLAAIPDNKCIGVGLWDTSTGKQVRVLEGPGLKMHAVAFSPDGKYLACAGMPGEIVIFDPSYLFSVRR